VDLSPFVILFLMTVVLLGLLIIGMPIGFALGSVGVLFTLILWGPPKLMALAMATWEGMGSFVLLACLMFYLMAYLLQESGLADDLFEMMAKWLGFLKGGLALGVVGVCAIIAAMAGVGAAGTITTGLLAIPAMLKRGYSKSIALGCVSAGGPLGILIPPSVPMLFYGAFSGVSVSQLFVGGFLPGLVLTGLFWLYIILRCHFNPSLAPAIPKGQRATRTEKFQSLRAVFIPMVLIFLVLGTIYLGICTPSESAALGAAGTFIIALIKRRLSQKGAKTALTMTVRLNAIALWCYFGGTMLATVLASCGIPEAVQGLVSGLNVNRWYILMGMQLIFFVLGMFLEPIPIIIITIPVFAPIIKALGFDPLWFGILYTMNMQMGYLTPPFGFSLIYMKAIAPKGVTMEDIILAGLPFIGMQAIGLAIVMIFPVIATWLPNLLLGTLK
jgi:tripartite ATP-independent transporter DctM subunit